MRVQRNQDQFKNSKEMELNDHYNGDVFHNMIKRLELRDN